MVKIYCYFLFFGSLWSFFGEDLLEEEVEGMYDCYIRNLCLYFYGKVFKKFFLGDLFCFVFVLIVMEVDDNNGLGVVEVM